MTALTFANPTLNAYATDTRGRNAIGWLRAGSTLATWGTRVRTRAHLRRLDVALYPDIGLTTAEVLIETAKPFWRA